MERTFKRVLSLLVAVVMVLSMVPANVFASETETSSTETSTAVAKVGNTAYATIDEAIDAWTNGTTLTLLANVTLTDVVTLKSTEHHILNLGTYTLTAASGKNAFVIQACGTGDAERTAITINADATNPGGINAGNKCVVYYKYADGGISTNDRPIIKINGGVFTGSTSAWGTAGIYTIGTAARKCATLNISGGTFNCSINGSGKSKLIISGGTFNYSVGSQGDSTALRLISGGKFKTLGFMTADSNNTKFWFGTSMANSNVGLYVDTDGYLVVGGPVITEVSAQYPAVASNATKWSSYLAYSAAATYGLFYKSAEMAINKHGAANVTVWEKPAVTIPENVTGNAAVVEEIKNNTALKGYTPEVPNNVEELVIELKSVEKEENGETTAVFVYDVTPMADGAKVEPTEAITFRLPVPASITAQYAKIYHDGDLMGVYAIQGEDNAKYVEVSSADFSEFAVEPTDETPVASINGAGYTSLAAAINAAQAGDTITILAGTISEGTIKLPATLKNVTIKGEAGAVLKDMTISAADGNSYSYIGLTFEGLTFDNSRILLTGWRNGEEVIEDLTITNCVFKNLYDTSNSAPIHINKDASEAVKNFTFTNNVIDGATGGSKSGVYAQLTGKVVFTGNIINNVSFRPYVIQITTDDGIADEFTVTGNTFSGSAVGRAQGLGNNSAGTDTVKLVVSENIFEDITESQQICYWNFNSETTTADLSKNYYDVDIVANPGKIYFNSAATGVEDLVEMGVYPYYTELKADGTINEDSLVNAPVVPTGTLTNCYTSDSGYWGECGGNASESFVLKFYNGDTYMGYTSLNNIGGIIDGDVYVSWHIKLDAASNTDEYWTMAWEIQPTLAMQPTRCEQWVDGVKVAEVAVEPNWPDKIFPVVAAVTDENGVILSYVDGTAGHTLADAVAAGGNIVLLSDVTVSSTIEIPADKTVVLDLNGKTINAGWENKTAEKHIYVFTNYGTLTIQDSAANAKSVVGGVINTRGIFNYGKLTLNGGTINAIDHNGGYGVRNYSGAEFVMNGGSLAAINENGDPAVSGNYDATALGIDSGATVIINGGTISSVSNFTYAVTTSGTLTVNGGSITGRGGIAINGGITTITGGTISNSLENDATGHAVYIDGGEVKVEGGNFVATNDKADGNSVVYVASGAKATITGGTFTTNEYTKAPYGPEGNTLAVSGGTFDKAPDTKYLAEGFELKENADGTFGVEQVTYVAQVGDKKYNDLQEAIIAAAKTGDTIILLKDVAMTETYVVRDMTLTIGGTGTLTLNDKLVVYGETTLNISAPIVGEVILGHNTILKDSTINGEVFVAGKVTFRGDNTVDMLYDYGTLSDYYGTEANMEWTVEAGATLTMRKAARYGLGYGDKVTIYGELEDALTAAREQLTEGDVVFFTHGLVAQESKGWNCESSMTVKDAYVIIGSNNSFGNKPGNYGGKYTFNFENVVLDGSRITFYEALSTTTFSFKNSDVKVGTFMTNDADSTFTLTNTKFLSTATTNGNDEANRNAGKLVLVNSDLTYNVLFTNNGVIELDINSTITAPAIAGTGKIVIDATGITADVTVINADLSGFTGTVEVIGADYEITSTGLKVKKVLLGSGTEEDPFKIGSLEDLILFRDKVNAGESYQGKYIVLTADIDLSSVENWTPIGNTSNKFKGYFDGNGKTISNLKVSQDTANHAGLFGYIEGTGMSASATPSVKDLTLTNVAVSGNYYVGGLAGQAYVCNITNVSVSGTVSGVRYIGGLVGHVYTYFKNCTFTGTATCSFDALGGIAGAGDCRAYDCTVIATISGNNWVGGIVGNGQEGTSAVGCYVKGTVSSGKNFYRGVGGIAGVAGFGDIGSEFKDNYFDGEVYLEGAKVDAIIMGIFNADSDADIHTTIEGNSWSTEYYPATTPAYVVVPTTNDATAEEWVANASEKLTTSRNNNLVVLESDIQYVDAKSIDDVTFLSSSKVAETNADLIQKIYNNAAVAKIGDTYYATLQEAIEAVQEGETIVVLTDINFTTGANGSTNGISYVGGASFTLDLNGKTITSNLGNNALRFKIGDGNGVKNTEVTITIKNGKLVSGANNWCAISAATADNSGNKLILNLEDLQVEANKAGDYAVKAWAGAVVNAKNVDVTASYAGGFYAVGGEMVLDNCTVNQTGTHTAPYMSMAVAVSGNGKMTVNSGSYTAVPAATSDAYNQGTSHGSWAAGVMSSGGTLIINGGTFTNGNVGEDSLATAARALLCIDAGGKLIINGGNFNALKNVIYLINNIGSAAPNPTALVSGGTFSNDPTVRDGYGVVELPEKYEVVDNGDGTYAIIKVLKGTGTEEDPYQIGSLEDLILFRDSVNAGEGKYNNAYVKLMANIDLSSVENWTPIGNVDYNDKYAPADPTKVFSGVFDGNGKTISNLKMSKTVGGADNEANLGLFGITGEGAVIKNLTITNVNINTDGRNVGALVAFAYKATLDNITVNGNIQIKGGNNVAGVCAMSRYNAVTVTNITVKGNDGSAIVGNNIVGGIFAEIAPNSSTQTFENLSVENVAITGVGGAGGIVGLMTEGTVDTVSVKNVVITAKTLYQDDAMGRIRMGAVAGLMGGKHATIANATVENVTAKNLDGNAVVLPIIGANYDASSNATEAKIGNTFYATLEAALAAAKAGDIIDLLVPYVVEAGETVVLDLKGATIVGTPTENAAYAVITNKGNLTIKDTVGGKILCDHKLAGSTAYAVNTIVNSGTLTIEGGIIENKSTASNQIGYAIDNNSTTSNAFLIINGGEVKASGSNYYDGIRLFCNSLTAENSVTVNGGEVSTIWMQNPSDGASEKNTKDVKGSVEISGGKVGGLYLEPSTAFEGAITGGEIGIVSKFQAAENRDLTGFITGGTFNADVSEFLADGYKLTGNGDGTFDAVKKGTGKVAYRGYINNSESRQAVQIDLANVKAYESLVIKLYDANGNLLTTTTLKAGAAEANAFTCNIVLSGTPSGSWDTVIHAEKLTVANAPATIEVIVDGEVTDTYQNALGDKYGEYYELACVYKAAKIGGNYYATITEAINAAQNGDTIVLLPGTIDEVVNIAKLNKTITIKGADNFATTLTGGIVIGVDDNITDSGIITIEGINFVGKGVIVDELAEVYIKNNKFANTPDSAIIVRCDNTTNKVVVEDNVINGTGDAGIRVRTPKELTITGNTIENTKTNGITVEYGSTHSKNNAPITITDNTLKNWAYQNTEGRAIRIALGAGNVQKPVTVENNVMIHTAAPEQFVKITDNAGAEISVDQNYWSGKSPVDAGIMDVAGTYPTNYYSDAELKTLVEIHYVAQIGDVKYESLQAAVNAANARDVITLLANGGTAVVSKELTIKKNGFTASVSATEGLTVVAEDSAYVIKEAASVITGEAAIGGTIYATLADAIAAAQDGSFINLLANIAQKPENVTINKNLVIIPNGYALWEADATVALGQITDVANFSVTQNFGIIFISKLETGKTNVAQINGVYYTSIKAALEAAKPGDTIVMIADSNEPNSDLVINEGITVKIGIYTLTARSVSATNGAYIYGDPYVKGGEYGVLKVGTLVLGESAPKVVGNKEVIYNKIPIWDPNQNAYVFTRYNLNHDSADDRGLWVDEDAKTIKFKFSQSLTGDVRKYLINDGTSDNRIAVKVKMTWDNGDGTEMTLIYTYKDEFVEKVAANTHIYALNIGDYESMGVDIDTMRIQAYVETNSGAIAYGTELTKANSK